LFPSGNFRGRKFFKWGRVVTSRFLVLLLLFFRIYLFIWCDWIEGLCSFY